MRLRRYLIRDRDWIYGSVVTRRLRAMGIRDKPIAPASPWQNGFAERLIGSIRRECVDHIIVLGEADLRRILKSYADYYNGVRTHRSLARQGCARFSPGSASRCDQFTRHPGRTSSPLRPRFKLSVHSPCDLDGPAAKEAVLRQMGFGKLLQGGLSRPLPH
jgi:hypothetical protein